MINDILDVMELIVEYLSRLAEEMREVVKNIVYGIAFILILTTAPVWILPFLIWKRYKEKDRDDEDDVYDWDEYTSATR